MVAETTKQKLQCTKHSKVCIQHFEEHDNKLYYVFTCEIAILPPGNIGGMACV